MINLFYNLIFIPVFKLFTLILRLFNKKVSERYSNIKKSHESIDNLYKSTLKVWFHAASMGEFEQAKSIIELLKTNQPDVQVICSFFSPSGYNTQKNYKFADSIVYLPDDTYFSAKKFIEAINPDIVIFVRYEIWRNYLKILKNKGIPTLLINATIPGSRFLKEGILKQFFKSNVNLFDYIITVGSKQTEFFNSLKINSKIITQSDTRLDRISQQVEMAKSLPILPNEIFSSEEIILVAGSTWEPDENILISALKVINNQDFKIRCIFVPHEPTKNHIEELSKKVPNSILLSHLIDLITNSNKSEIKDLIKGSHIIVDSIGKLLKLYSFANIAYIGGGFGVNVHSVSEPAGYGIPLISGPRIKNSHDALELLNQNALKVIKNQDELTSYLAQLSSNEELRKKIGKISNMYVNGFKGSSKFIYELILKELNLLNN